MPTKVFDILGKPVTTKVNVIPFSEDEIASYEKMHDLIGYALFRADMFLEDGEITSSLRVAKRIAEKLLERYGEVPANKLKDLDIKAKEKLKEVV